MLKRALYGALSLLLFSTPILAMQGASCDTEYCPLMAEMSPLAETSAEPRVESSVESAISEHCEASAATLSGPAKGDTLEPAQVAPTSSTATTLAAPKVGDCCWTDSSPSPVLRSLVPALGFSLDAPISNLTPLTLLVSEHRTRAGAPHRLATGTPPPALYSLHRALLI